MTSIHSRGMSPRLIAAIEQFDVLGDFLEHRIERVVEQFEARDVGVAQIDHDGGALGRLDARLAHCILERIAGAAGAASSSGFLLRPHIG